MASCEDTSVSLPLPHLAFVACATPHKTICMTPLWRVLNLRKRIKVGFVLSTAVFQTRSVG